MTEKEKKESEELVADIILDVLEKVKLAKDDLTLLQAYEIAKQISELIPGTTPELIWDMLF